MKKEITIFDKPANVRWLIRGFYAALAGLVIADFWVHKHGHFPFEDLPQFFAAYGFVACVLVIFGSKVLRFFLKRSERYYDDENR